jgi:hypothetical protein
MNPKELPYSIVLPLINIEHEEEREVHIYMVAFVEDLETQKMTLPRNSPTKRKSMRKKRQKEKGD